jgi:hypothetical protein
VRLCCAHDRETPIEATDAALYAAKRAGKNQTAQPPGAGPLAARRLAPGGDTATIGRPHAT